jgi:MtrB/PioB family decaheme-associated outer membrane protein
MKNSVLSVAVHSALAAMFAMPVMAYAADAAEAEAAALRHPTSFIEIGAAYVSDSSAKFGEYNGLNDSGGYLIGNFDVYGGDAYAGGDGTTRWSVTGSDIGTTSRELGAKVESQGNWNLSIGYDQLRHNITDTYQTPQQGSMGGNTFTLPADFGTIVANPYPSANQLTPTQLDAFQTKDVSSTRKNTSFGAGYHFSPQLSVQFDYNHLDQSGAKLIGGAALGQAVNGGTGTWRAEAVAILMNPTNYTTDTFNLGLNWVGDKGFLNAAYFGSLFKDGYDQLSWENPMLNNAASSAPPGVYQTNTLSTAPDNELHQLLLTGGYAFSPTTKLSGGFSYGWNTQDNNFLTGLPEIVYAPRSNLDGEVITTHADLMLTNQTTKDLKLTAAFKYNERDNKSPSNIYQYYAINNMNTVDYAANAPYSYEKTEFGLAGDYRLDKRQSIRLAYDYENIDRSCKEYALDANCLIAKSNTDNKVGIQYKLKANNDVNFTAGYSYSDRTGDYDFNAVTPLGGLDTPTPDDVNSQNFPGFIAYIYAPRKQNLLKAGVNWQANENLGLSADARYASDDYSQNLGVEEVKTTGINLDATYIYSANTSFSAYYSWQNSKRDMRIGASGNGAVNTAPSYDLLVAPTNIWTNKLNEDSNAVGINSKHRLMDGKLELAGDLMYSLDTSGYSTQVPYNYPACAATTSLTCGDVPDIRNRLISFKLTGLYTLDKSSRISAGYLYQNLNSEDYFYNTYQYGYTPLRVMPTNQQSGSYHVNVFALSYVYNFQ